MIPYLSASGVFLAGVYAVLAGRGRLKAVVGVVLIQMSLALMLVLVGYRSGGGGGGGGGGGEAPVVTPAGWERVAAEAASGMPASVPYVDPVAQALALVWMVVSLAVTLLGVAVCTRLRERRGAGGAAGAASPAGTGGQSR